MNRSFPTLLVCFALGAVALVASACSSTSADSNDGGTSDSGTRTDATADAGGEGQDGGGGEGGNATGGCSQAAATLLGPVATVSTGDVQVVSSANGTKTIFVNASAGGPTQASRNARVYVSLTGGVKVDVSDEDATSSTDWDLSLKRHVIFTNGGHGGPGEGAAAFLAGRSFDSVDRALAEGAGLQSESFFDEECTPKLDPINAVQTTFSDWYEYQNEKLSPRAGTWIVKGGSGALFKMEIVTYYGLRDGGVDPQAASGAMYVLKVAVL